MYAIPRAQWDYCMVETEQLIDHNYYALKGSRLLTFVLLLQELHMHARRALVKKKLLQASWTWHRWGWFAAQGWPGCGPWLREGTWVCWGWSGGGVKKKPGPVKQLTVPNWSSIYLHSNFNVNHPMIVYSDMIPKGLCGHPYQHTSFVMAMVVVDPLISILRISIGVQIVNTISWSWVYL